MSDPLDNPLELLTDDRGGAPPWVWKAAGMVAGIAGAALSRKLIDRIRGRVSVRGAAPLNPADKRMTWPNALLWAGVLGIGASLGRMLAQRAVATVWAKRSPLPVRMMPAPRS